MLVFLSMSIKSIFAPQYNAQFADATNVLAEVTTISFLPTSKARQDICNAEVALFTAKAYFESTYSAISSSNFGTLDLELKNQILKLL